MQPLGGRQPGWHRLIRWSQHGIQWQQLYDYGAQGRPHHRCRQRHRFSAAKRFAESGDYVLLADVDASGLEKAVESLQSVDGEVRSCEAGRLALR